MISNVPKTFRAGTDLEYAHNQVDAPSPHPLVYIPIQPISTPRNKPLTCALSVSGSTDMARTRTVSSGFVADKLTFLYTRMAASPNE